MNIRTLLMVGGRETNMMKDTAEFAKQVGALGLINVTVTQVSFPDENHSTVSLAALGRALRFALN
jgi:hypothetical protein